MGECGLREKGLWSGMAMIPRRLEFQGLEKRVEAEGILWCC